MAAALGRLSLQTESIQSDQEKDANTLFVELDKGLRSLNVGERCEAIVKFPRLFEKYPFPIIINSAFIKLSEVFLKGNNLLRLGILQVTQQSQKHLDKIINVSAFLQNIYFVIHSNDPVARALTLRTLGWVASIAAEQHNIHHSVINSLDSHDPVELDAAVDAANKFCSQSKSFTKSISKRLSKILEGLETPYEMKLKIVPSFQYFHHDQDLATEARSLLSSSLKSYPQEDFVLVSLHTLSLLSAAHVLDTSQQVDLLLDYLITDCRTSVKALTLQDLQMLARKAPHMWTKVQTDSLISFIGQGSNTTLLFLALKVLSNLLQSVAVYHMDITLDGVLLQCCRQLMYHACLPLSGYSCHILTQLALLQSPDNDDRKVLCDEAVFGLQNLILSAAVANGDNQLHILKICLLSIQKLCSDFPHLTETFARDVITALTVATGIAAMPLCQCLASLGGHVSLYSLLPDLQMYISQLVTSSPDNRTLLMPMVSLLLQAVCGYDLSQNLHSLLVTASTHNGWTGYCVARQAMRFGQHGLAYRILKDLQAKVSSESNLFWLLALTECSKAEESLGQVQTLGTTPHYLQTVSQSQDHYHRALIQLKAVVYQDFQCEFITLRTRFLQSCSQLLRACNTFKAHVPPAMVQPLVEASKDESHKFKLTFTELHKSLTSFSDLAGAYSELYKSCFDADEASLLNIQLLQQSCEVLQYILDTVLSKAEKEPPKVVFLEDKIADINKVPIEHKALIQGIHTALTWMHTIIDIATANPLSNQHMDCITKCVLLLTIPLKYPRFFFQQLQATDIKLAVTPSGRQEPFSVSHDTDVSVTVEGICQSHYVKKPLREVGKVCVSIKTSLISKGPSTMDNVKLVEPPVSQSCDQTQVLHNEYFKCPFVLGFDQPGLYSVGITTSLIDTQGAQWSCRAATAIQVKSTDHDYFRQQQLAKQQQRTSTSSTLSHQTVFK